MTTLTRYFAVMNIGKEEPFSNRLSGIKRAEHASHNLGRCWSWVNRSQTALFWGPCMRPDVLCTTRESLPHCLCSLSEYHVGFDDLALELIRLTADRHHGGWILGDKIWRDYPDVQITRRALE